MRASCERKGCREAPTVGDYVRAQLAATGKIEDRGERLCEAHGEAVLGRGGRWYPGGDSGVPRMKRPPAKKRRALPAKKRRVKRRKKRA